MPGQLVESVRSGCPGGTFPHSYDLRPGRPAKRAHMAAPNPFRIPVADLLKRHGEARPERVSAPLPALCGPGAEVPADRDIDLDLTLERVSEGIVVRGSVRAPWRAACSRCLAPVEGDIAVHVIAGSTLRAPIVKALMFRRTCGIGLPATKPSFLVRVACAATTPEIYWHSSIKPK